jgi:hypothetical protein
MSDLKKQIEATEKNLENLKKVQYLENFCAAMEASKVWLKTPDGTPLPSRHYLVNFEKLRLREAFMGYGTGHAREFEFPNSLTVNELMIDGFIAAAKEGINEILKLGDQS